MAKKLDVKAAKEAAEAKANGATPPAEPAEQDPAPAGHNIGDDVILKHGRKIKRLFDAFQDKKAEMDSARGEYRAALKDAKADGIDPAAFTRYLKNKGKDPDELDREDREYYRVARLMGLPIGTQLNIFEEAESPASKIDQLNLGISPDFDYFAAGKRAGSLGKEAKAPYPANSRGAIEWIKGHDEAQFQNQQALGKGKDTGVGDPG